LVVRVGIETVNRIEEEDENEDEEERALANSPGAFASAPNVPFTNPALSLYRAKANPPPKS